MAVDLPGHGQSAAHPAAAFEALVDAVGEAVAAVAGGLHLVGHSLGAAVAAALTERGDLDIRSLTLISPAGLGPSVDGAFVEGFLAARTEAALAAWMRRLVHDPANLAPVLVRATLEARKDPALVEAQARVARGVFEGSTQLFSVAAALRRFGGPTTVIAGRDDAIIPFGEIAAQVPPNAALHRLERTGHLPQVEAADLVRTLVGRTVRSAG
jgi:pyruvate dehydrogenase E2 component (dihydrolipoamide acetyltransferase)